MDPSRSLSVSEPSVKRIQTNDDRATAKFQSTLLVEDNPAYSLAATIRAASMRVRKSVTEGYLSSPPSSHLKQAPPSLLPGVGDYPPSARENNRKIFSSPSGTYSPLPSPSKRKQPHSDTHDHDDQLPIIYSQSPDQAYSTPELGGDDMDVDRPMKPLRRSRRIRELTPTRSSSPSQTEMNSHQCEELYSNTHSTQLFSSDSASDNEPL